MVVSHMLQLYLQMESQ